MPQLRVERNDSISAMARDIARDTATTSIVYAVIGHSIPVIGVGGGALFGAVAYLSTFSLVRLQLRFPCFHDRLPLTAAKVVFLASSLLGGMIAGWWALAAAGFSLTLAPVAALACAGWVVIGVASALSEALLNRDLRERALR
ncbi:MAG TPA: hypothetical protein VLF94_00840 [Chlamydiales bacterium]|nr:hypothetical protein [Chlamydiales bacterium]